MSLVLEIVTLQEIDDRIAALRAALASLQQRLARNDEVDDARRQLQVIDQRIDQVDRRQRTLELDIGTLNERIVPDERKLFSGEVKNSKELVSLQQEVETLKANRGELEDQLLEAMTRMEQLQPRRTAAEKQLAVVEKRWEEEQQELRREARRHEDELALEDQRRDAQVAKVPPRPLHIYEDVRRRKGGVAVARLQGHACGGCRVTLPDALRRQVLVTRDAVIQCPNCERILVPG